MSCTAGLLKLPESVQRQLALQLHGLIEKYGLTGEHLSWHQAERAHRMKEKWRRETFSPDYPEFVDHVGITQTVELAKERFGPDRTRTLLIVGGQGDTVKPSHLVAARDFETRRGRSIGFLGRRWCNASRLFSPILAAAVSPSFSASPAEGVA